MKKILLIIFLLPATAAFAQNKNLSFYHLSVENGLPKRTAMNAIQDKYGYIWAATGAGLIRYDGYNTKVYLTELGIGFLSEPSTIYEDHEGELWVGTLYKGLFRYDRGADTFRQCIFSPGDSATNYIEMIQEDGSENIWSISSNPNPGRRKYSLNCLNKKTGKWQHFSHSDSGNHHIDATQYFSLLEDHEGQIWIGTNNGIYGYDSAANRFIGYRVSKDTIHQFQGFNFLYEPPSEPGIIWMDFGTMNKNRINFKGLLRFNTKDHTFTTYRNLAGDTTGENIPSVALEDKAGNLWMGTFNGLLLFNPQAGTFTNYPTNAKAANPIGRTYINCVEDKAGNLWYSNNSSGLFYFTTQNKTFTHYLANPNDPVALQSNLILGFLTDRTGTLWVSGSSDGLQWINKAASIFTGYPNKTEGKNNYSFGTVSCYAEAAENNIWLGTDKGLVLWNRHNNSFELVKPFKQNKFYTNHILCILTNKKGTVWYGTDDGLIRYDPVTGSIKNYFKRSDGGVTIINCIYEDHQGIIWVGTIGRGLFNLDPKTGRVFNYPLRPSSFTKDNNTVSKQFSSGVVIFIDEDKEGTLWIGTNSGLDHLNRKDSTFTTFIDISKGFTRIRTFREDKNGLLWLGTWEGGLFHFNPKTDTMQQFTEKNGLLFNAVYSYLQDSSGMFWLTSPRGITRFDPLTGSVHPITTANGLPAVHIDYGGFKTKEGNFLISTSTGFIEFNPDQFTPDPDAPIIHIETISYNLPEKENGLSGDSTLLVFGHNKVDLDYNENRITFHYVGIHYQNAAMTQYAYKLDGYDKNWIQAGTERSVTYTNLSPGTYTFYVKAVNSDGVWSKESSIIVVIHPPWWKTWWAYLIYGLLLIAIVWGLISYRSRNLKRKNQLLEKKVSQRTGELKQSLENLKSTQKQLIQSEKMASLGELTAGIAHEIQNPLNFVNNFSDINQELIGELQEDLKSGNVDDATALSNDIKANSEKIIHHGKRADAIVKGMLQHSRTSSGVKEPTDINALCDEYLRLSYHGLRAKDKSFNATMKTDFDESIGKINIIPQDIGRVLLNIINNAFYACAERSRSAVNERLRQAQPDAHYEPTVTVSTKKVSNSVTVTVRDNGNGIPDKIKDKIFQPFFTTKPTGSGTGLGLSLAYDIVKAHGGSLSVESKEGEGTEFIIQLLI